jgi:hypothetical protein
MLLGGARGRWPRLLLPCAFYDSGHESLSVNGAARVDVEHTEYVILEVEDDPVVTDPKAKSGPSSEALDVGANAFGHCLNARQDPGRVAPTHPVKPPLGTAAVNDLQHDVLIAYCNN